MSWLPSVARRGAVPVADGFSRPIVDLPLSVTDRRNLRCVYYVPAESPEFQPREELLSFEEMERVTRVFVALGVRKDSY